MMDGYDIAGEIRLERQVHKGSFLLVEGTTDIKRFHPLVDHEKCSTVNCYGKKNLVEAILLLYEDGFPGVLGLADADFDRVTNSLEEHEGLIYSVSHDFDADWACENSMAKYVQEVGNPEKCAALGGPSEIGVKLRTGLKALSVLRYLNEYQSLSYRLKSLRHDMFIQNMAVDLDLLIDDVFYGGHTGAQRAQLKALVVAHSAQEHDLIQLTSGHDLMRALGLSMRTELAERKHAQTWGREVEMHFRLLFGDDEFRKSPLFTAIRAWEAENTPYVILAARLRH
ncbi:DUF4435 domain-containing protein [Bradyrhizobium japonicum]|uniref:DUF4435 domain-containing protein n=1 Tax=Bradyrhizobium japonicum TaxID=375 RepID=UPI00200C7792|nr:DUF4435 domain-containing protein [Bradyrhizobium japonicum]UQD96099.1 hypothetical protein JEY30_31650 [Bradyrhizobium japonicum]